MPVPLDRTLYERVKRSVYKRIPKQSAYRSGILVQEYKRLGGRYSGSKSKSPLGRWFAEKWTNQRGGIGYASPGDVYRPTRRMSKRTPTTFGELSKREVSRAMREKRRTGRVARFRR